MYRSGIDTDVQFISGVGPKRAKLLEKELGASTIADLIRIYPFRYIDRSTVQKISDILPTAAYIQIQAKVVSANIIGKRLSVIVDDGTGQLELVFFRGIKYTQKKLEPGRTYLFFGKPTTFNGAVNMVHPEIDDPIGAPAQGTKVQMPQGVMTGVYPSTESLKNSGITGKVMNKIMAAALRIALPDIRETLPDYIIAERGLCSLRKALKGIHFPANAYELQEATYRLKFEELFFLQLSLLKQKYVRSRNEKGILMPLVGEAFNKCYKALPYDLTSAQKRVVKEIRADLLSGHQMNRLLQGDVGSGKTMVAVLSCLLAIGNGCQACIMAPTEVLAQQHYANIKKYLAPTGVTVRLLTGSTREPERREIHSMLEDGSLNLVVGTHALIEDTVRFKNLGMAVIDEQHRFGVEQRSRLWSKNPSGIPPHVLVMTATPIPRTLAMTLFGDLDVSVIDEMPPGRKPIQTLLIDETRRSALNNFMKKEIAAGHQVFIVYPMIYVNDKVDYKNLEQGYEKTVHDFPFPPYKVAIVHGQQTPDVKAFNMDAFASGRANILVSTTVIEVGVDVPNASVMVIEGAERFGLSQLHQLRGRVGRGADRSYCVLVRGDKISKESMKRLELIRDTQDGFALAEEDMKLRGPGDLEGTQQSGLPVTLGIASLARDGRLLEDARKYADHILSLDPTLSLPANVLLAEELRKDKYKKQDFSKIS